MLANGLRGPLVSANGARDIGMKFKEGQGLCRR